MNTRGFTLVEMLMALLAFALLSSAAMALLDLTLRNKESFDRASAALQDLQVTRALMKADFAQATARPVRGAFGGAAASSFSAGSDGTVILALVRRGWENPGGNEARSSLQYVEYVFEGGALVRRARPYLDAAPTTPPQSRKLLAVSEAKLMFLAAGKWQPQWRPVLEDSDLPDAVAITLNIEGLGEIRQAFLTGGP